MPCPEFRVELLAESKLYSRIFNVPRLFVFYNQHRFSMRGINAPPRKGVSSSDEQENNNGNLQIVKMPAYVFHSQINYSGILFLIKAICPMWFA